MPNRLAFEKSPYLLQHAHNPVNWHPWCAEAFRYAEETKKPIFLSIGYAACHWCHVMEKESFEDPETAHYLNETFICIKVDREERPDIDSVYMSACQILTGTGGWPLTIFMTPDKLPFFAGTYIPKLSRFGRAGLIDLCKRVQYLWTNDQQKLLNSAKEVLQFLQRYFTFTPSDVPDTAVLDKGAEDLKHLFDHVCGGFGSAPKFPTPHRLLFLLRYYQRTGDTVSLDMAEQTLKAMRLGGIWDFVGFGFHRYSTDDRWHLPHFEKMLYDQALLAQAYAEAFCVTKDQVYARTAQEIFTYVLRDLTSPEGGFYSAEDADSDGEEGRFYVWKADEFKEAVKDSNPQFWAAALHVEESGNFADEASQVQTGHNILFLGKDEKQLAELNYQSEEEFRLELETVRKALYDVRSRRNRPLLDDKILTDWNGLMIASLSQGGRILGNQDYIDHASKAARFILSRLTDSDQRLLHRYRDGEAAISSNASDYAFLITGFIELYQATLDSFWLQHSVFFQQQMIHEFWDTENGGFFLARSKSKDLPVLPKELSDGALPSANSAALCCLLKLSRLTGNSDWETKAYELLRTFSLSIQSNPTVYSYGLLGIDLYYSNFQPFVIVGSPDHPVTKRIIAALQSSYHPNQLALLKTEENAAQLSRLAPFTKNMKLVNDTPMVYDRSGTILNWTLLVEGRAYV